MVNEFEEKEKSKLAPAGGLPMLADDDVGDGMLWFIKAD